MKQKYNPITEGPIASGLMRYFFPIVLGSFFQTLYNTVDAIIVGQFVGKEALGAVGGSTGNIIALLVGFFVGLSSGAGVVIAQLYGAKNAERIHKAVHTSMALALTAGVLFAVVGVSFAPWMASAIGVKGQLYTYCVTYLRIYFGGMLASLVYNMGTGILRAVGDSKRPLYFLITSCLINIVLDLLFVGVLRMEVAGAALATVLCQLISAVLTMIPLLRTTDIYRVEISKIRFYGSEMKQIFRLGLPAGFQSTLYAISNVFIQSFVNAFDTDVIAAWSAYTKIDSLFWMSLGAMGVAAGTFVGQNYGAGNMPRVHKSVRTSLWLALIMSWGISIVTFIFGLPIMRLFTKDEAVLAIGIRVIHFLSPMFFTFVWIEIYAAALRAMGDSFIPMVLTCFGVCVLRIGWCLISRALWPGQLLNLVACYPITWIFTSFLFFLYYRYYLHKNRQRLGLA